MKKYFLLGLMIAIAPNICFGGGARYTQLVREKQRKMEELEKCMGATNGLKIAGLSTIGLTAVGVAGNVAEAKKLDEYESGIKSKKNELEKVNKDIAEKEAEIKKAKEAEEAAAAAQKKAEEEARNLYETNCSTTGGTINENGICVCSDQKPSRDKGSCIRVEVIAVQPNIAGSELTGVISPNNNSYTWNPVATNDGQNSVVSGSGSTPPIDNNKNVEISKTSDDTNSLRNLVRRDIAAINATPASLGAKIYVSGYNIDQLPQDLYDSIYYAMNEFTSKCDEIEGLFGDYPDDNAWGNDYNNTPKLNPDDVWEYTERYVLAQCVQN